VSWSRIRKLIRLPAPSRSISRFRICWDGKRAVPRR
jgi:hypothetical protein